MYSKEVKKYVISHYSGGDDRNYSYRSIISLEDDNGSTVAIAYFHRDPDGVPATDSMSAAGYPLLHYPDSEYDIILDILRNESPVQVSYIEGGWNIGNIRTSAEPVGEGELE